MKMIDIQPLIDRALAEDMPAGDVTTEAIVPPEQRGRAVLLAKENGILAGIDVFARVFKTLDPATSIRRKIRDGQAFNAGQVLAEVSGRAEILLKAERTALNFVQRMSGIATTTREYVAAVGGTGSKILDTRKTTPGLRDLEKYAVRKGGGQNHRRDLSAMVLVKDNHLAVAGSVREAVRAVRTGPRSVLQGRSRSHQPRAGGRSGRGRRGLDHAGQHVAGSDDEGRPFDRRPG